MPSGNAGDWSYGDMLRNEDEINAANVRYEVTAQQPYSDEREANRIADMLRKQAVSRKTGALVDVRKEYDKGTRQTVYVVRVHNPAKTGKKK